MCLLGQNVYSCVWVCVCEREWVSEALTDQVKQLKTRSTIELNKYIRFDVRSTHRERQQTDKFSLMSWVFGRFVDNSQKCYMPEESLTVDEQLFPKKARCRFTQ